ncbi:MAG: YciI family protein [Luteimonas sp.]
MHVSKAMLLLALSATATFVHAQAPPPASSSYDAALARRVGADARGMRHYVLVILRSGPTPMAQGRARDAMFEGHFANIARLAKAGKLALAGPFGDNPDGWRGLFVFAVDTVDEARALTQTDPVILNGEMVAEYHPWYGSAAAMLLPELHERLVAPAPSDKD